MESFSIPSTLSWFGVAIMALTMGACSGGDGSSPTQPPSNEQPPAPTAPSIVSITPQNGAGNVDVAQALRVTLDDAASGLTPRFNVEHAGTRVPGSVGVNDRVITFEPTSPLSHGATYMVDFELRNATQTLVSRSWTFTTEAANETDPSPCAGFYEPDFTLVTGFHNNPPSDMAEPVKGVRFADERYGTCIIRATDHANEPVVEFSRNDYSRRQAFNINNTRFIASGGKGFWHIYDANSLEHIKRLDGQGGPFPAGDAEPQWDPTNPDIFYFIPNYGGMVIYTYNAINDAVTTRIDFTNRLPWPDAARLSTRSEGSPSADGRYWGFQVETQSFEPLGLMVWDSETDTITTMDMPTGAGRPGYVSMSPSGDYLIAGWSYNRTFGTRAYTRDLGGNYVQLQNTTEHSDIALLPNGNDAYVAADYDRGYVFMFEIQTNQRTDLFDMYLNRTASSFHFSGKAFAKPGWVLVSSYNAHLGSTPDEELPKSQWEWPYEKIFAMSLTPNPEFRHIAYHHGKVEHYFDEIHASANRDFTRILYNTSWRGNVPRDVDAYMVVLPKDALD